MKKTLIILGILIFILIVGVWAYVFTNGTTKSDMFAKFGTGSDNPDAVVPNTDVRVDTNETTDAGAPQPLRQLTTRPVAGAGFTSEGIRYVEQGTGHIYEIHLSNGSETLLSGTTIPGAYSAVFSPDNLYTAITVLDNGTKKTVVGMISDNAQFVGASLPEGASNISFNGATGTIQYTLHSNVGTVGYSYNIDRETGTQVFSLPLRDIRVLWGNPVFVYTVPSSLQEGYLYRVEKSNLKYVTKGFVGLQAQATPAGLVLTWDDVSFVKSGLLSDTGLFDIGLPQIPEKCVFKSTTAYCGIPNKKVEPKTFPDEWYKGLVSYSDTFWMIDTTSGKGTQVIDFLKESGREIDISMAGIDTEGELIYLVNKNDNTLWLYDLRSSPLI